MLYIYCVNKVLSLSVKDDTTDKKRTEKMKDKKPTLLQNQKSCIPTLKANAMQHICFCPNAHDQLTDFS